MGSSGENMAKKTVSVTVSNPEVDNLKALGRLLIGENREKFVKRYGNILDFLELDVQVDAISSLVQFYDPDLRCFIFKDFQLAPTLEEFEQILGYPLEKGKPYCYPGKYPRVQKIANVLKVNDIQNLKDMIQNRKGTSGFPRSLIEEKARCLAANGDWVAFRDVLALIIYGTILFPSAQELIDYAAIDVFLAYRDNGENPTYAVLADVYYTLYYCYEKKGKRILCCLPSLYVWLVTHIFKNGCKRSCPINDFMMCDVKPKTRQDWAKYMVNLDAGKVRWSPKWKDIDHIIFKCGTFPNVPLMGTKGVINYNPVLALRQLGHPHRGEPAKEALTTFVIYDMDAEIAETRRVQRAWNDIVKVEGREIGKRSCEANTSYRSWLRERVQKVKLPFHHLVSNVE